MEIVYKQVSELVPYANNPRKNDGAVEAVAKSIEQFGFKVPLVIDKDNVVVAGHTRLKASKKLGLKEVPCIVADDLTDEQVKAFRIADNSTAEIAEWDFEKLDAELKELSLEMDGLGLEELDIKLDNGEVEEDDFDFEQEMPSICKLGDIWQLGKHRLVCGDSTDEKYWNKLGCNRSEMVLTDPPYNMNYQGSGGSKRKGILNDNMQEDVFLMFLTNCFKLAHEQLLEGGSFYAFYKEMGKGAFLTALNNSGLKYKQCLVWVKNNLVLGGGCYHNMYESCIFGTKGIKTPAVWNGKRKQKNVIEGIDLMGEEELRDVIRKFIKESDGGYDVLYEDKPLKNDLHPTMKPVKLLAKLIRNSSSIGGRVIDMFGGSGSTLIACEQLNRSCYMMELDPKFCDVIIKRWETLTGKKAVLENGNKE